MAIKSFHHYLGQNKLWTGLLVSIYLGIYLYKFITYRTLTHYINQLGTDDLGDIRWNLGIFFLKLVGIHLGRTLFHYLIQKNVTARITQIFSDLVQRIIYYRIQFFQVTERDALQEVWHYLHNMEHLMSEIILHCPRSLVYLLYYTYTIYSFSATTFWTILGINMGVLLLMEHWHQRQMKINDQRIQEDMTTKSRYIDAIRNITYVKTSGWEKPEMERILSSYQKYHTLRDQDRQISVGTEAVSQVVNDALMITIYWFGSHLVLSSEMTVLDLMYLAVHTGNFFYQIVNLRKYLTHYRRLLPKIQTIFQMMNYDQLEDLTPGPTELLEGDIVYDQVEFSYGKKKILQQTSFQLQAHQINLLVGPNGCGKSTAIKLLFRLYDLSGGQITIGGRDIQEIPIQTIRQQIAFVLQEPSLFNDTLYYNLVYGVRHISEDKIKQVCEALQISDWVEQMRDQNIGVNGSRLSGGEKKRLQLANILLQDPQIIIFDEPTNALDPSTVNWFLERLQHREKYQELWDDKTIVIITHDTRLISLADHLVKLHDLPDPDSSLVSLSA